jgi:alkyl hydroperoxide reductase subunit AhpC
MKAIIQKAAPQFKGQAWSQTAKSFKEVTLDSFKGKNLLLVFYPLDFTFVCPTEIQDLSNKIEHFNQKNTEVLCVSVDSHFSHRAWVNTPAV